MAIDQKFLKTLQKELTSIDGVSLDSSPPRYWFSTGNVAVNYTISGDFDKGIPQGRIVSLSGNSGAGKTFLACNIMREAQNEGAFVLVIDSENAIDDKFVTDIGVDISEDKYMYVSAATIPHVSEIVSTFIKGYKKEHEPETGPKVLIVIDSLDMLLTESEQSNYDKGDTKGDQGQRAKQLKAMLRTFVQDIKELNVTIVCTNQVYQASQQQILMGEGMWVVNQAVRYAISQILLITKLKRKDKTTKEVDGIRMKVESFKTRFSSPFQTVTIEVPYSTGMDKYSGLMDVLEGAGQLTRAGSWYQLVDSDIKFQSKNFNEVAPDILEELKARGTDVKFRVTEEEE